MTLANYTYVSGAPNPQGVLEAITIVIAMYKNRQTELQDWLNRKDAGQIIAWTYRPDGLLPSYCVIAKDNVFTINISGTENFSPQCRQHLTGANGEFDPDDEVVQHAYFATCARAIYDDIKNLIPDMTLAKFRLQGHSLGGSSSSILSTMLVKLVGQNRVELLTFGEPRSACHDKRLRGRTHIRCVAPLDVVPSLPPVWYDIFTRSQFGRAGIQPSGGQWGVWQHYGTQYILTKTGGLVQSNALPPSIAPQSWLETINSHPSKNYANLIVGWYRNAIQTNMDQDTLSTLSMLLNVDTGNANDIFIKQSAYINPDEANRVYFGGVSVILSANNVDAVESVSLTIDAVSRGIFANIGSFTRSSGTMAHKKVQIFINALKTGRSQTFYLKNGLTDLQAKDEALLMIYDRSCLLGNGLTSSGSPALVKGHSTPVVETLRITDVTPNAISHNYDVPVTVGMGWRQDDAGAASEHATTLLIRGTGENENDANYKEKVTISFSFPPDAVVVQGKYVPGYKGGNMDATYAQYVTNFKNRMLNTNWGFMGKSSNALYQKKDANTFAVDDNTGNVKLKCVAHGVDTGWLVKISSSHTSGYDATWKVQKIDADNLLLEKSARLSGALPTSAKLQAVKKSDGTDLREWYKYIAFDEPVKVSSRRPGGTYDKLSFNRRR